MVKSHVPWVHLRPQLVCPITFTENLKLKDADHGDSVASWHGIGLAD